MKPLNKYIDHTLLKAEATPQEIKTLCSEAAKYGFYSVCVNSAYVPLAQQTLSSLPGGCEVKIAAVCGFPLGACTTAVKVFEADEACENGASEIDMVINIGLLKSGDLDGVFDDIKKVADKVHARNGILKVIIETCLLTDDEKKTACDIAVKATADFVKTSTGFSKDGATIADIALMKNAVQGKAFVKASGGIRDKKTALAMIQAGADRIGASASVAIIN